ncbi:MAG: hypothetical protein MK179_07820 [Pirellulaceae bacterium]|nr:hypothetical protein [Pirellulaceae bacterium]
MNIRPVIHLFSWILCNILVFSPLSAKAEKSPQRPTVLNNLVTEIMTIDQEAVDGSKTYSFQTEKSRWVYVSLTVHSHSGRCTVTIDQFQDIISWKDGQQTTKEAMRYLVAGNHQLQVHATNRCQIEHLVVRSIPDIMLHNFTDRPLGKFNISHKDYLEKHIIPNVNTFLVPGAVVRGEHEFVSFFEKWRLSGRRWLSSFAARGTPDVGGGSFTFREAYDYISSRPQIHSPLVDGYIIDEFVGYDDPSYSSYGKAIRQLKQSEAFQDRLFYIYIASIYGSEHGRNLTQSIVDTGGILAWERYLKTQPTEAEAHKYLQEIIVDHGENYREQCPGSIEHLAYCAGFFSRPGGHNANLYPGVNHKVYLDMQFHLVANDPTFRGVRGLAGYHTEYSDEETLRWLCHLFRHYGIEGKTERATDAPYMSPHLINGDFVDKLNGWTVDAAMADSVRSVTKEGLGYLQARDGKPQGDTALLMIRNNNEPNRVSQLVKELEPGKTYVFKLMTGDYVDMSSQEMPAIRIQLDNVELMPAKSFTHLYHNPPHRKHPPYDGREHKAWQTYHYIVFRAESDSAMLTISDWAQDDEPGAPAGQQLFFNYIQVHPYFLGRADSQE